MIFRKVADVKKEKELAEKRKNDPPLELSSDHPVRKLISRFRKISDAKAMQTNTDPEKGSKSDMNGGERGGTEKSARSFARLINVTENSAPKTGGGSSKWGKMMNGSGPPDGEGKQNKPNNESKEDLRNGDLQKPQSKPASKWGKMMGKNSEPSRDNEKEETQNNLRKTESMDSGIIRSNVKLDHINEETVEQTMIVRHETNNNHSISAMSLAERQMLTSLHDIKLEMKEDMDILHQKMNRIDEQIAEILRMFSPSSSSCSSHEDSQSKDEGNSVDPETSTEEEPKQVVLIRDVEFIPKNVTAHSPILYLPRDNDASTTVSNSTSYAVSPVSGVSSTGSNSPGQGDRMGQQSSNDTSNGNSIDHSEGENPASKPNAENNHLQPPSTNTGVNSSHKQSPSSVNSTSPTNPPDPSPLKGGGKAPNTNTGHAHVKEGHHTAGNKNVSSSQPGVHRGVPPNNHRHSSPSSADDNSAKKGVNSGRPSSRDKAVVAHETGGYNSSSPLSNEGSHYSRENTARKGGSREDNGAVARASPSTGLDKQNASSLLDSNRTSSPINQDRTDTKNRQDAHRPSSGNRANSLSPISPQDLKNYAKSGATAKPDEYPLISSLGPAAGYSANPMAASSSPRPISPKLSSRQATSSVGPAASISDVSMIDTSSSRDVLHMAEDVLKMKTKSPRVPNTVSSLKYSSNIQKTSKARMDGRPETRRVAGGIRLPLDNDGAHIKDRDLDIL